MTFSELEKIYERESRRLSADILKPVVVNTVEDLKMVLGAIDPKHEKSSPDVPLGTTIPSQENDKPTMYKVTAITRSKSKREILIEGMDMVKRHLEAAHKALNEDEIIEVNGRSMTPAKIGGGEAGTIWVDPLIRHWLGGYRENTVICWDIDDYQYQYDIYYHKLSRIKKDEGRG